MGSVYNDIVNTLNKYLRRIKRDSLKQWGFLTAQWRTLPNFIILGAHKAGTSSLWYYLKQHLQVRTGIRKEIHFYDFNYHKGLDWYRAHFPFHFLLKEDVRVGEASPYYLFYPYTASRIAETLPNPKLVILLRNPSQRAVSHYFHSRRKGKEPFPLKEALLKEEERLTSENKKIFADPTYRSYEHRVFSYKQRGLYLQQIKRYYRYFDPEQLLILSSEEFFESPERIVERTFQFLGLNPEVERIHWEVRNLGKDKEQPPRDVLAYLDDYFAGPNQQLYDFLGKDFGW